MTEEYCNFCGTPDPENPNKKCARTAICSNSENKMTECISIKDKLPDYPSTVISWNAINIASITTT